MRKCWFHLIECQFLRITRFIYSILILLDLLLWVELGFSILTLSYTACMYAHGGKGQIDHRLEFYVLDLISWRFTITYLKKHICYHWDNNPFFEIKFIYLSNISLFWKCPHFKFIIAKSGVNNKYIWSIFKKSTFLREGVPPPKVNFSYIKFW